MTWRGTAGLLGFLLVLVVTIAWVDWQATRPEPSTDPPLLPVSPAEVTALDVLTSTLTLRFVRGADGWRAIDTGTPTDAAQVDTVLDALASLVPLMTVESSPNRLNEFGLGSDALRLIARSGNETVLELDVGKRNPAWTAIYVRLRGAPEVRLVGSLLRWELEKISPLTLLPETRDPTGSGPAKEAP